MEKLNGLRCRECGRRYPATPVHVCEFCFGPLAVDYRYDTLQTIVTRESIAAEPPPMWRGKAQAPLTCRVAAGQHSWVTPPCPRHTRARAASCRAARGHYRIAVHP